MIALQNSVAWEKVGLGSAFLSSPGAVYQPVQGFDYAKQHLGRQGGDEETLPASQDTLMMSLQIRDTPLALEKTLQQDGTGNKKSLTSDKHKRYRRVCTRPRFPCCTNTLLPVKSESFLLSDTITHSSLFKCFSNHFWSGVTIILCVPIIQVKWISA